MRANIALFALCVASAAAPSLAAPHSLFKVESLSGPIRARAPMPDSTVAGLSVAGTAIGAVGLSAAGLATYTAGKKTGLAAAEADYGYALPKGRTVAGYRKYFDPDRTTEGYEKFQEVMTKVRQQFPGDTGITADSVDLTKEAGAFVNDLIRTGAV